MTDRLYDRTCQKVQKISGFLGYDLARLALRERKTIDELLSELNINGKEKVTLLLLCRSPRKRQFVSDVKKIAEYIQIKYEPLVSLLRKLEVFDLFSSPLQNKEEDKFLIAARESENDDNLNGDSSND
jgi:hypothetical protein